MNVSAIDPGTHGALAVIDPSMRVLALHDTPTEVVAKKPVPSVAAMADLMRKVSETHGPALSVVLELPAQLIRIRDRVIYQPTLWRNVGNWEMAAHVLGLPLLLAPPNVWKRAMGVSDKGSCRIAASRLFPGADLGKRGSEGRSEALLLAAHGLRVLGRAAA